MPVAQLAPFLRFPASRCLHPRQQRTAPTRTAPLHRFQHHRPGFQQPPVSKGSLQPQLPPTATVRAALSRRPLGRPNRPPQRHLTPTHHPLETFRQRRRKLLQLPVADSVTLPSQHPHHFLRPADRHLHRFQPPNRRRLAPLQLATLQPSIRLLLQSRQQVHSKRLIRFWLRCHRKRKKSSIVNMSIASYSDPWQCWTWTRRLAMGRVLRQVPHMWQSFQDQTGVKELHTATLSFPRTTCSPNLRLATGRQTRSSLW